MYAVDPFKCPLQSTDHVLCYKKNCAKCGWNPEVAQARLDAIVAKMMEKEQEK